MSTWLTQLPTHTSPPLSLSHIQMSGKINVYFVGVVKTNSRKKNDFGRIIDGIMKAIHRWMIQSIR